MSLPVGVTTCHVVYSAPTLFTGSLGRFLDCKLTADRQIVHTASGQTLYADPEDVTPLQGQPVALDLPHVDQAGFVDASGAAVTGWHYVLTGAVEFDGKPKRFKTKVFQVTVGQTLVDLDLIPDGIALPPTVAPAQPVTSVAGRVGQVTAQQLAADLSGLIGGGSGSGLVADPNHPGFFLITDTGLTPDPDHPGFYLIGA